MRYLILAVLLCFASVEASDVQTFFVYTDNAIHPLPANVASVQLEERNWLGLWVDSDCYAGAIWGEHDLSGRDYCVAFSDPLPSGDFDEWLAVNGYRCKVEEEE